MVKVTTDFYVPKSERRAVGRYEVDTMGRVFRNGCQITPVGGGRYVNMCEGGEVKKIKISYLVARAFIPNTELRPYVIHKNGDKSDNRVDNLEWSEVKEKRKGAMRVMCVLPDGTTREFDSVTGASEAMFVSRSGILKCLRGELKTCGGMEWIINK